MLVDQYALVEAETAEEAFELAKKSAEKNSFPFEKTEFKQIDISTSEMADRISKRLNTLASESSKVKSDREHTDIHERIREVKIARRQFRTTKKNSGKDKAYAIAEALIELEEEEFFGHDKPVYILPANKGKWLIFGFYKE